MTKTLKIVSLIAFVGITFAFSKSEPIKITWEILKDVKFSDKWSDEFQAYYAVPSFGNNIKKYNGQEVQIRGYIIPIDIVDGYYVLSANPYSQCFFCGNAGPESVMEIQMKKEYRDLRMDQIITYKGKLRLNKDDIYQLNYILEDAEIVAR
ncbi:MAG: DUF3299 domain-containing protein [Crocinitomicaceae bacterium]|jgi:hypothetical protein|nr:DUF3299 domain-containing protein [Crocinitomicaceae bacterium]MBT5403377.1 DUF3299 domain-containing protein [Crocinitomicaceae bacterium]MBT6514799.1 DUF3299 domain-containing protein [Crocinitomicaceae bacterium]MDG2331093.1 DUF3299 domain-containing protein [Flavobacteriales bacterium]